MSELFGDRLTDAARGKAAPICVGIDPMFDQFPAEVTEGIDPGDTDAVLDAVFDFTTRVLRVVAPLVPVVKFQSAYFERYLWDGVEAYYSLVREAKDLGLLVIGDVKRGDIGTTAAAYADGHLDDASADDTDDVAMPDAITVNPMLGADTLAPFVRVARETDKGLFVLVRTSNPGSAEFQDVPLADGRTWSELVADRVATIAAAEGMVGSTGYSSVGAVVGATQPQTMRSLRERLPKSIFLLPGYGAQGATADMTRLAFHPGGTGAVVSASRSILYAHKDKGYAARFGDDWERCVEQATLDMKADLGRVLG
ncbi:MAG: orotidine 5-phosphate decarboxylase [Phycisphaerales bacterium]|nr:orotidine 5-phosphate decarboxylase [Phycisphaerales bacterium]